MIDLGGYRASEILHVSLRKYVDTKWSSVLWNFFGVMFSTKNEAWRTVFEVFEENFENQDRAWETFHSALYDVSRKTFRDYDVQGLRTLYYMMEFVDWDTVKQFNSAVSYQVDEFRKLAEKEKKEKADD